MSLKVFQGFAERITYVGFDCILLLVTTYIFYYINGNVLMKEIIDSYLNKLQNYFSHTGVCLGAASV